MIYSKSIDKLKFTKSDKNTVQIPVKNDRKSLKLGFMHHV